MNLIEVGYWTETAEALTARRDLRAMLAFKAIMSNEPAPTYEDALHHDRVDPRTLVDATWAAEERRRVIVHLEHGEPYEYWNGWSDCRICGLRNGTRCLTDGIYRWPEGFAHYLRDHQVKPPQAFIDHVLSKRPRR